jgi:hypothetical protein
MPTVLRLTVANMIYFDKAQLPQALANRLIRLAAFQNPEFYRAQAMRMSVWDKPRVIGCAENFPKISSTRDTPRCCECGISANVATGRWAIECFRNSTHFAPMCR